MSCGIDQPGGARDAGDRDEPHRREIEHRRGRRGSGSLHQGSERRLATKRRQASGIGEFGVTSVPRDCTDLQIKMAQGAKPVKAASSRDTRCIRGLRRCGMHTWRQAHLAAAASRHLFDRRPRAADSRSEELESRSADHVKLSRSRASARSQPVSQRRTQTWC